MQEVLKMASPAGNTGSNPVGVTNIMQETQLLMADSLFSFHMQGITNCKELLSIYSRESFLKYQDVHWTYKPLHPGGFFIAKSVGNTVGKEFFKHKKRD